MNTDEARRALRQLVVDLELRDDFSPEVNEEVARLAADPRIDDLTLVDLTHLPFVTIDGATSKDLDQALYLEARQGGGFDVHYALADAAHFVPSGSALFQEALQRGATFYFPGFSVPMLPRQLSEGLVSLNPKVDRRALVFTIELDASGAVQRTSVERGRIHSRAKLAWGQVQAFYDTPAKSPLSAEPFATSLEHLRTVGERRMALAELQNVVRYRRREVELQVGEGELGFVVLEAVRDSVELYNEQISLLVNREGGRLLATSKDPRLQPIYRVHPAPDPDKITAFSSFTQGVARLHQLDPAIWALSPGESLNALLGRLPTDGPLLRVTRAIERQAILVNMRSAFSVVAAEHFGVGAEVYARFSAPMREVVGIFLHKEMLELCGLSDAGDQAIDETLRDSVVDAANRSREMQRRVNDRTGRMVIDHILGGDLAHAERPRRRGTVMGITPSKLHIELDSPGLDVKIYLRDIGKQLGGAWLEISEDGAGLVTRDDRRLLCRVGDAVDVHVVSHDAQQDRWVLGFDRV